MRCRATVGVLAFLLTAIPIPAGAERLPVKTYTTADGLPNNYVQRIVSDSRGFIWFCTREGLSRYDGYVFANYGLDHGLPSAVVNDVLETRDGTYWVATSRGLARFDSAGAPRRMFVSVLPDEAGLLHATSLLEDREGRIWVGTMRGLFYVSSDGTHLVRRTLGTEQGPEVLSLAAGTAGVVWAGANLGLYRVSASRADLFTTRHGLPGSFVPAVTLDRRGDVWIGTASGLARLRLDVAGDVTKPVVQAVQEGVPFGGIVRIIERHDGTVWVASTGGLAELDAKGTNVIRAYSAGRELDRTNVNFVAEDRHGYLWLASAVGATKILPGGFTLFGAADAVPWGASLVLDKRGELLVMDAGGPELRLLQFDGRRFASGRLPLTRAQASWGWNQMFLVDRQGDWWIGTRTGVLRYRGIERVEQLARATPWAAYTRAHGLAAEVVIRLFEDSRGDVWIATVNEGRPEQRNGLSRWRRATGKMEHFAASAGLPLDQFFVSALAEDRGGGVWIGLAGEGGLARFADEQFTRFIAPGGAIGSVRNLLVDSRGRLWAAVSGGGLVRSDAPASAQPILAKYSTSNGLSSNIVTAIAEDAEGRIYASTARGLDRLDLVTGQIKTYRAGDGLLVGEVLAALRDRTGALWFSYISGVVRLVPTGENRGAPATMLITRVQVSGDALPISPLGQSRISDVDIAAGRNLQIEFVAPGSGPTDGRRYQHQLQGGDGRWSLPSDYREVTYANLMPGTYRFSVRAVDSNGATSREAAFAFTVLAPIWQRWWFASSMIALVVVAGHLLYRRRVVRLLEVARMRTRIATDLHDDIGANLTRIAILSEVVRRQPRDAGTVDNQLASIASVARESVTSMSDIVWAISPERDTLGDLVRKMREYAGEMFTDRPLVFEASSVGSERALPPAVRRELYLIFKEAANNAARHATAAAVRILIRVDRGGLELEITDDGPGFDVTASAGRGNGLGNMRKRAERLGGWLSVTSSRSSGTTIRLRVPTARLQQPYLNA